MRGHGVSLCADQREIGHGLTVTAALGAEDETMQEGWSTAEPRLQEEPRFTKESPRSTSSYYADWSLIFGALRRRCHSLAAVNVLTIA
jgi:hypothetical protein